MNNDIWIDEHDRGHGYPVVVVTVVVFTCSVEEHAKSERTVSMVYKYLLAKNDVNSLTSCIYVWFHRPRYVIINTTENNNNGSKK